LPLAADEAGIDLFTGKIERTHRAFAGLLRFQTIHFICLGVSSHVSVAHRPKRNDPISNLHKPPFFNSTPASSPPEISNATSRLK